MRCLWVVAWDGAPDLTDRVERSLASMTDVFPDLVERTALPRGHRCWAAAVAAPGATGAAAAAGGVLAVVDGLAVSDHGDVLTADVAAAADRVDPLAVDGQFTVLRCSVDSVELVNDAFGLRHAFAWRRGGSWVLSNSAELIARAVDCGFDEDAAALYLAFGWVPGDRTLLTAIRQVPPGQHWRFDALGARLGAHFRRSELVGRRQWRLDPFALADRLEDILRSLADHAGSLYVPLSAGMDSRLVAALAAHAGVPASYYTVGDPASVDAVTAPHLAAAISADHDMIVQTIDDIVGWWRADIERYVAQNDGMTSMWVMGDMVGSEEIAARGAIVVQGLAGELARWNSMPLRSVYRPSRESFIAIALRRLERIGLTTPVVRQTATAYADRFVEQALDEGFTGRELIMVWYLSERARRWGGANNRKISNRVDVFTPFTTRAFTEAAFQLRVDRGYTSPIHHALIKHRAPRLYAIAPEHGTWDVQVPYLSLAVDRWRAWRRREGPGSSRATSVHGQHLWVGRLRDDIVSRLLDETSSPLWELVDRAVLESVLTDEDDARRQASAQTMLTLVTLLEYGRWRRSCSQQSRHTFDPT